MSWAAIIISILALGVSVAAAVYAKQSADAARRSARADERSATAAEESNRRDRQRERESSERRQAEVAEQQVRWKVRHDEKNGLRCRLDNLGTHDARGVRVSLPRGFDHPSFGRDLPTGAVIGAKESIWFEVLALNQIDHVFVTWEGHPEPVRVDISGPAVIV